MEKNKKHGKHHKYFKKIDATKVKKTDSEAHKPAKAAENKSTEKHSASHKKDTKHVEHKKHESAKPVEHKKHPAKETKKEDSGNMWIFMLLGGIILVGLLIYFLPGMINNVPDNTLAPTNEMGVVVVTVNGQPVYSGEIEKRVGYYQAQYGPEITEEFVINQTVNEILLLEEAKNQNIEVNQARIDNAINDWLTQVREQIGEEQMNEILSQQGLTQEEYVEDLRLSYKKNFMMMNLLNETVLSKLNLDAPQTANVSEEEILAEFENNRDLYKQVQASHILICYEGAQSCTQNRTKEEAFALIEDLYGQLVQGADFAELAVANSDCGSAASGGDLGYFAQDGSMVAEFEDAAFALKNVNQFSEPIETAFGYHIIKLTGKKDSFEDFKTQISMQLQFQQMAEIQQELQLKQQQAISDYVESLRQEAVIDYTQQRIEQSTPAPIPGVNTFSQNAGGDVCMENGKPVVYLFTSTTCPHCTWVGGTFDDTVKAYVDSGDIVAYHWELDTGDNTLTEEVESSVPVEHMAVYQKFNPRGSIPTFVFGCQFYRIGTGYERENSLSSEANEFKAVIAQITA